jgi:hypothetical protein
LLVIQTAVSNYWITENGELWRVRKEDAVAYSAALAQQKPRTFNGP